MGAMMLAFLAEMGLITYRDVSGKDPSHLIAGVPIPADYLAAVAVFGTLGLVPKDSPAAKFAAIVGWGLVLATYLNIAPGIPKTSGSSTSKTASTSTTSTPKKGVSA